LEGADLANGGVVVDGEKAKREGQGDSSGESSVYSRFYLGGLKEQLWGRASSEQLLLLTIFASQPLSWILREQAPVREDGGRWERKKP
jgi:hypothetical protein